MSPFGRDGHLHDLGLEQVLAGDLDDGVDEHLAGCPVCAARLAAARTDDALAPPLRVRPANRGRWLAWGGLAAAVVAATALITALPVRGDLTPKGALALEVYLDHGDRSQRLLWGDRVEPGDRLGFRARASSDGELLVVGVDSTGAVYPCWPPDGSSRVISASPVARDLPAAIRLDATPGPERIVAVWCEAAFGIDDLRESLVVGGDRRLPDLRQRCLQDEIRLLKEGR